MSDSDDAQVKAKAVETRLKRMRSSLGWSVIWAIFLDFVLRRSVANGQVVGTNLAVFSLIAVIVYFSLKPGISRADPQSFLWEGRSPWLVIYWVPAVLAMLVMMRSR